MNEFKIIKETINELEYQETNGLLTDRGMAYLKELNQALQLQQTGVSGSVANTIGRNCPFCVEPCVECSHKATDR